MPSNFYMFKRSLVVLITLPLFMIVSSRAIAQSDAHLEKTLKLRGLTSSDLSIPINFDDEVSARAGFKLILPAVKEIMLDPEKGFSFPDTLTSYSGLGHAEFISKMFALLESQPEASAVKGVSNDLRQLIRSAYRKFSERKDPFSVYTADEKKFLKEKILAVMADAEDIKADNTDIFSYNRARDSSISVSKRVVELLGKADRKSIFDNAYSDLLFVLELARRLRSNGFRMPAEEEHYSEEENVDGAIHFFEDRDGILIAVGSDGPNRYTGQFDIIIDTGGDDVYDLQSGGINPGGAPVIIIDLSGNDIYSATENFALASAFFGSSFIFDAEGNDVYRGEGLSIGSAICGLAVVIDEKGNDVYKAVNHSIGAATFGVGAVIDGEGNDTYIANSNSQGFGSTQGVGVIKDNSGNDSYLIDARSLDIGRYEDHYISMCQGYGNGVRPYFAGGIGIIIEGSGNDIYNTDIFGQGGAYWFSMGCIADKSGNDKYNSYQYGQGAGIHLAVGLLKDYQGWDFYSSNGVSQGCGHDYGIGVLHDVKGNDNYSAYSLSQGAGNANGVGILLDEEGRDGYLSKEPANTRGYGNSRREYGSIGLFADAAGEDFYSVQGRDSSFSFGSVWGGFTDFPLAPSLLPGSEPSNSYRIRVDSAKTYTLEELFIMAKTIEPRFSQWKDYGFRKLVEDSASASAFVMKYLDTEDHREALVLRDLAQKIGHSVSTVIDTEISRHLASASAISPYNTEQLVQMCYLLGEAGFAESSANLLELSYDGNRRIRSSAVNALGKLRTDNMAAEVQEQIAARLREIISDTNSPRITRKDAANALKKYKFEANIPALQSLLHDSFFGARFNAADCLASYGNLYYDVISFSDMPSDFPASTAFLISLGSAGPEDLIRIIPATMFQNLSDESLIAYSSIISGSSVSGGIQADAKKYIEDLNESVFLRTSLKNLKYENEDN